MTIRLLPPVLVNRIAAGEVVERPASALKELVENALDAGADEIDIVIKNGGRNLISVTDNGSGMGKEHLELSVDRHATSKLPDDNLLNISNFGFRGEALPSIGAVGRLSITSKAEGADESWVVSVEGGDKSPLMPAALNCGTKVELRDLFFATPARLKFLKSENTEQRYAVDAINRIAMSHPTAAFTLTADGRKLIQLNKEKNDSPDSKLNRISKIIGKDFSDNAVKVNTIRGNVRITGYISVPTYNRGTSAGQYFFVNNRPVKDKLIYGAVRAAYQDFLARDRHPVTALYIDIAGDEIDVNVHPAKTEIRFRDSDTVRKTIMWALKNALANSGHQASTTVAETAVASFSRHTQPFQHSYVSQGMSEKNLAFQAPLNFKTQPYARAHEEVVEDKNIYPLGAAKCQMHETYIVAQTNDGIVIVDQHAAHERLVYEKMKNSIRVNGIETQKLLIPETIEVNNVDELLVKKDVLEKLGLVIEKSGDNSVTVYEIPAILGNPDIETLVHDIADDLTESGETFILAENIEKICTTMACHGSIRSGRLLSINEMNALLRDMESTPYSGQCGHGRPTYVELKLEDIEKLFGRR